jgi:hypothetical protein
LSFRKNQSFSGAKSIVYLDLDKEKVENILKKLDSHLIKRTGKPCFPAECAYAKKYPY